MRLRTVLAAALLVLAACSDDGGGDAADDTEAPEVTEAGDPTSTTEATTTTAAAEEPVVVENSPLSASLAQPYGAEGAPPIIEPNSAGVLWYDGGETWVAVFVGLDIEGLGAVCPGTSMEVSPGTFEHNSNAPTEEGACEGFPTDEGTVRACGNALVYESLIPMDAAGTLYASVERNAASGDVIEGITSMVAADAASAPPLDPSAETYDTPDGVFTCEPAVAR